MSNTILHVRVQQNRLWYKPSLRRAKCLLLYQCEHGGVNPMGLKPNPLDLSSVSALTLLAWSFDL